MATSASEPQICASVDQRELSCDITNGVYLSLTAETRQMEDQQTPPNQHTHTHTHAHTHLTI